MERHENIGENTNDRETAEREKQQKRFDDSLLDLYYNEKALKEAWPSFILQATSEELKKILAMQLQVCHDQVKFIERIMAKTCKIPRLNNSATQPDLIKEAERT